MRFWPAVLAFAFVVQGCISNSPLHQAVEKGDQAKVAELLQKGAKVDTRNSRGCTPLFLAADEGDEVLVKELLDHGADPTKSALLKGGNTPLHVAAEHGFDKILDLLLTKSPNVDLRNSSRATPLMLAAWARKTSTVTLLIKHGADATLVDRYGWTAIHTPLDAKPADADYTSVMDILVANKAPVNAKATEPLGYTPLMGAAMVGDKETVELLLDKGAGVNEVDEDGHTAYSYAARSNYADVLAVLSDHGGTRYNPFSPPEAKPAIPQSDLENP